MKKAILITLFLAMTMGTVPAGAQSRAELALKVERLEREMIAQENRLRGGQTSAGAVPMQGGSDNAALADMVAKMGTMERQMRSLTGKIEELEYRLRQQDQAMEMLRKELDLQRQEAAQAQASRPQGVNPAQPAGSTPNNSGLATAPATDTPTATTPAKPTIELPAGGAAEQYRYAFEFIRQNDLDSGFTAMEMFLKANPGDDRVGSAKFWLGRIHLLKGRMPQAAQQLLALIEEHPNHEKRVDALVDLADVLIALDSASDACNALAEFRRSDAQANDRLKARAARTAEKAGCS
ncbi:tetratricopeptide repeat protein [Kordiimonas sp.]|uniref:tetratricopeptide repeat protein n=1 Tax=Kordiimonas sp. TaxID=1970157 RepID=UPI003A955E52